MFEVCKGLFFFIYCPLLPFLWLIEMTIEWIQKRQKKARRKREYRAKKEERQKQKDNTYLLLDKYTRGEKEKKLIDFKKEKKKAQKKRKEMDGTHTCTYMYTQHILQHYIEIEEGLLSNEDSNDTTATDEVQRVHLSTLMYHILHKCIMYVHMLIDNRLQILMNWLILDILYT